MLNFYTFNRSTAFEMLQNEWFNANYRISYKSEDQNYKMTEFEQKVFESKKKLLGDNTDENGSEALSNDSEVKLLLRLMTLISRKP